MKLEELAGLHKALALPVRLRILELIADRPLCVKAITCGLEITQPAVSQHLAVLRQAGLVSAQKQGYMVHYSLDHGRLRALRGAMELFARQGGAGGEGVEAKAKC